MFVSDVSLNAGATLLTGVLASNHSLGDALRDEPAGTILGLIFFFALIIVPVVVGIAVVVSALRGGATRSARSGPERVRSGVSEVGERRVWWRYPVYALAGLWAFVVALWLILIAIASAFTEGGE